MGASFLSFAVTPLMGAALSASPAHSSPLNPVGDPSNSTVALSKSFGSITGT